jgi:hypothetical protein
MSSDFICARATRETSFLPFSHFHWCMAQRSLHVVTKVSHTNIPSCTLWFRKITKYDANPHSIEHDTLPIVFLISRQVIPYWTRGSTCCPGVSTPKIWFLADSSTTCHDNINQLHHSNRCSNHSINPYHGQITAQRMEDHLSQRHKPNSTSQRMEDLYGSHDCMTKHN